VTRVLVVCAERVGERMAGPAIRALELARALAHRCQVTLAAPGPSDVGDAPVELLQAGLGDFDSLLQAMQRHDVVVAQALPAQLLRHLRRLPARYVADLYNPLVVEVLEAVGEGAPRERATVRRIALSVLAQAAAADLVICASEKQRDLWLGGMAMAGLVDVEDYRADPTYRSYLEVVPFGIPEREPRAGERPIKGRWPGIAEHDAVLLWGGGIWRWLDPFTPIRAVERLAGAGRRVHLFFIGTERPALDPAATPSEAGAARAFARQRGLDGELVHFKPGWVPYEQRDSYLLDADLGISAHHDHLEARFSFRTRVLDYVWAGLPAVVTGGDSIGELVQREGLGRAVAPGDDEAFAAACAELLDDPGARERVRAVAPSMRWSRAAAPLVDYCANVRERPAPRKRRDVLTFATWAQYPLIAGDLGPGEAAKRAGELISRALRHRG
jgi:glycosyltransferase involved in cell wall biosynthesis